MHGQQYQEILLDPQEDSIVFPFISSRYIISNWDNSSYSILPSSETRLVMTQD